MSMAVISIIYGIYRISHLCKYYKITPCFLNGKYVKNENIYIK